MDEQPKKRRPRSDKGKPRSQELKNWRATIYLSRTTYPAKTIVKKLEDHFKEFPGDNMSKLFEREMSNILNLPLTQEATLASLIDRLTILTEEQELKIEAIDERIRKLDRLINRLESGGFSVSPQSAASPVEQQSVQRTDEGAAYLGNMFGGMKSRHSRTSN